MGRKTIYVKPEKEALYEKAVKLSNKDSLSAILEEAVENLVKKMEGTYKTVLLIATLNRFLSMPYLFRILVNEAGINCQEKSKELWDKANYTLDVFYQVGIFDEDKRVWLGPRTGQPYNDVTDTLWYRGFSDDLSWLDEMYEIATGSEFNEYEDKYKESVKSALKEVLSTEQIQIIEEMIKKRSEIHE